ncbi:reverse transcriptase domain-containing protein [Tanacetum coccineum]
MSISDQGNEPWYADYEYYLASRVLPVKTSRQEKQKFFSDLRHYLWDEPYLFKQCADQIIWRCVAGKEASQILRQCYNGPSGGHHGVPRSHKKFMRLVFTGLIFFAMQENWYKHVMRVKGQGIDFMGPFPSSIGNKYILVAIDYVTPPKWVAAEYDLPRALLHRSIAQDMRTTSKRVV